MCQHQAACRVSNNWSMDYHMCQLVLFWTAQFFFFEHIHSFYWSFENGAIQNAKADYAKTYIEKSNSIIFYLLFCWCVETQVLQSSEIEKNFPTVSIRGFNTRDQFEACFPNGDFLDKCRSIFRIEFAMLFIGLFWLFPQHKFAHNDKVLMFFLFSSFFAHCEFHQFFLILFA